MSQNSFKTGYNQQGSEYQEKLKSKKGDIDKTEHNVHFVAFSIRILRYEHNLRLLPGLHGSAEIE